MQFCCLGSGSKGNATLIRTSKTTVLIDCGFSVKYMLAALAEKNCAVESIAAIFITHEHSDHISGVNTFAKRYSIPVYMSAGTQRSEKVCAEKNTIHRLADGQGIDISDLNIMPVTVPHDAREPCQFVLTSQGKKLGVMTDLGSISNHVATQYMRCDALLLEANHDVEMLWAGPYPPSLKRRVVSDWGHLSNEQAAHFLSHQAVKPKLLVLGHISEKNNALEKVQQAFSQLEADIKNVVYASQKTGFDWLDV